MNFPSWYAGKGQRLPLQGWCILTCLFSWKMWGFRDQSWLGARWKGISHAVLVGLPCLPGASCLGTVGAPVPALCFVPCGSSQPALLLHSTSIPIGLTLSCLGHSLQVRYLFWLGHLRQREHGIPNAHLAGLPSLLKIYVLLLTWTFLPCLTFSYWSFCSLLHWDLKIHRDP